jgi:hypothetical protein
LTNHFGSNLCSIANFEPAAGCCPPNGCIVQENIAQLQQSVSQRTQSHDTRRTVHTNRVYKVQTPRSIL